MVIMTDQGWLGADGQFHATASEAHESFARRFRWSTPAVSDRDRVEQRRLRVFLAHAKEDKAVVRQLYDQLARRSLDPWFDGAKLLPGHKWQPEISKAIRATDAFLACLSEVAVTKKGYIQREFKEALEVADLQPEGKIFIIPVKLAPCEVPDRFADTQWLDFFEPDGFDRLLMSLQELAEWLRGHGAKVVVPA
jgi:hypothetical protein